MSSDRPRIGITSNYQTKDVEQDIPVIRVQSNYTNAVAMAGGLPVPMVSLPGNGCAMDYAEMIDGLLLTGGPDMNPARWGEEPHESIRPLPRERDDFDMEVLQAVLEMGKPVFGICLGHQQVNVLLGGTLHQHLPDVVDPWEIEHRWLDRKNTPLPDHEVEIFEGTRLAKLVGSTKIVTNSSHHQGVDKIGNGLRQTAKTSDGVLEGLESIDSDQILSVQWHPEYLTAEPSHLALFEDLVARARRFRDR